MSSTQIPVTIDLIKDVSDPRIEPTVQVLGEAYKGEQASELMIGGREEFRFDMFRGIIKAYILGGRCYVATDNAGNIVGTVTWYPPGSDFLQDEPSKKALDPFFADMKERYPDLHKFWWSTILPAYWSISKFFPEPNPQLPGTFKYQNWNMIGLAVSPPLQRRGIGKLLLKVGIEEAKKANGVVCIETESEPLVKMYQHVGFRLIGAEHIEGPPGHPGYYQRALIVD